MSLTVRTNGSTSSNLVTAAWWNDYYNLLTGAMADQEVTIKNNLVLSAIGAPPSAAPTATPVAGTGMGVGVYVYTYTYVSPDGESIESPTVSATTTSANAHVNLAGVTVGPTGTTARNIYRTAVGGSQRKLLTTLSDNTTTTYTDSKADTALGANAPTVPSFGGSLVIKDQTGAVKFKINNDGSFSAGGSTGFGNTTINGTLTVTGQVTLGTQIIYVNDTGGTAQRVVGILTSDNDTHLYASPGNNRIKLSTGVSGSIYDMAIFDGAAQLIHFALGSQGADRFQIGTGGPKIPSGYNLTLRNGNTFGSVSVFTGTGSGTYNHTLDGIPDWLAPIVSQVSSSATQGYGNLTSTQATITLGASLAFKAYCIKG